MKRVRDGSPQLHSLQALPAHRFKPLRSQLEFEDEDDVSHPDAIAAAAAHAACCVCAAVCLSSEKAVCTLGHLRAHLRCVRALLAPAPLPAFVCSNGHSTEFSCWPNEQDGGGHGMPELLQAAAEPSAVLRICLAVLKQRRPCPAEPQVAVDFADAAAMLLEKERPWPSFPYMSALQAVLYGCELILQPCPDSNTRLIFRGSLLDSAEFSRVGEFILPPMKCASLGCRTRCSFGDFFKLGWLVHARAHALEEGSSLVCTCAAHAFSCLPATLPRLLPPPPPAVNVDFPTVDLFDCVQDASEGRCGVCLSSASSAHDALLLCGGCGVACHQSCCDANEVPAGDWYCQVCASGLQRQRHRCYVCPVAFGVLQFAAPPELFIHTSCAIALLGTRPSPSSSVPPFAAAAGDSNSQCNPCCGCGSRLGLRVSCRGRGCMLSAHAVCALAQGWLQQPHCKWLCAAHNDNPRITRDSAFEHKVGGVDGASRIIMAMSNSTTAASACPDHSIPDDVASSSIADNGPRSDRDSSDVFASQGVHSPVNWTAVGALPYNAPSITFPTSFSLVDAVFKLVQFPPTDVMDSDFFAHPPAFPDSAPCHTSPSTAAPDVPDTAGDVWSQDEDRLLFRAIQDVGSSSWSAVAQFLSIGRSRKQCKKRWWHLVRAHESGGNSSPIDGELLLAASRGSDKPFIFDAAPPLDTRAPLLNPVSRRHRSSVISSNSIIHTCHVTPMQRFAVIILAMMAQRELQTQGSVTPIAWDCIIHAFNALMDAFTCFDDTGSAAGDSGYVARSALSGALAVLSWLHRRACTGGGGSSRFIVVVSKSFFNGGTVAPTAADMQSMTSAFASPEFTRNPIPCVTVALDHIEEVLIGKNDAIVVLHGDRSGVLDAEDCIRRAAPRDYNQPVSHILPLVGLSDMLGSHASMHSVSVNQCAAVTSCLLAAALRGVHIFEIPTFLPRSETVQDAVLTSAAASARLIELMVQQFMDDDGDSNFDNEEDIKVAGFDDHIENECSSGNQSALIDAQTPAAAACRVCFCIATNGSLPRTSSVIETRSIASRTMRAAMVAWKCSSCSLAPWLLKASDVDLFWKRASQHAVSMMRHPGLQADMALCRFGDKPRHIGVVSVETLGVLFTSSEDTAPSSALKLNSTAAFRIGNGGRIVRSFWDAATGRHRCLWVTECLHNRAGAVYFCYGRSGTHEMFVGSSATDAWKLARSRILLSNKDGNSLIDMTCDVKNWLRYQDSHIVAEANFIISSYHSHRRCMSKLSYARCPGFVFAPIPPIESLYSTESSPTSPCDNRVIFPAATRRGVVLIDLNESGYIDVQANGNHSARLLPVTLDDGVVIQCLGYFSIEYAAACGNATVSNACPPLLNFKSVRTIQQTGLDPVVFMNSVVVDNGFLVFKINAKCGFYDQEFYGTSEVNAFNALLMHRSLAPIARTATNNAAAWFGLSSAVVVSARDMSARVADAAAVAISAGRSPASGAFVRLLPREEHASQSMVNCVNASSGINSSLSGIKYKAVNHSRGRQVDCDAVVFAQSKGSIAVIQHALSSRLPVRRVIRRGPSMLLPNSSVLLQLDRLDCSPTFKLTVFETSPVVYVGDSASDVMGFYLDCVAKCRVSPVAEMKAAIQHWTGESTGLVSSLVAHPSPKHIVFQAPDVIDVDASFLYKLPNEGICSAPGDCQVTVLSFGMGRVLSSHTSGFNSPLSGYCSVTIGLEGRAYVYMCQDDEVHWMHMMESLDGPAVLSLFARSFGSLQSIVRNSGFNLPHDDLFGFERARRKFLLPLTTQVSLESEDLMDSDLFSVSEVDHDSGMALFDLQDESSQIRLTSEKHTSLNSSYPHIGEQFEVSGSVCSSSFQISSAGVILKGHKLVYVNGLPISHGFHSTGTFVFINGSTSAFECTTSYTSSHGNATIKLALGTEGIVLRFTENSFLPGTLVRYFGIASDVFDSKSLSNVGGDMMVKLVGLAQVFSHRRVLGVIELMMPSYVVSVIKGVPSASDIPGSAIDLDMYLSCPHCCHGISVERWGSAKQDLCIDGLIVPIGFQSRRTLPDGRNVRCEVEGSVGSVQGPNALVSFSVSEVGADGSIKSKFVACSPQEAWFAFLGLDFKGGLHNVLERCGYNRCNGMVLFGLGVSTVQSLIHYICKTSVWAQDTSSAEGDFAEEEASRENFVSPFAACDKRQARRFSAAASRHTQTFLTWLESKKPQPQLRPSILGDLAPCQQIEHQDAAEMWGKVIRHDYGDYKEIVQRDFA